MVVAALAEQAVVNNLVDVELIKEGIAILLELCQYARGGEAAGAVLHTLETEAVKTTTS